MFSLYYMGKTWEQQIKKKTPSHFRYLCTLSICCLILVHTYLNDWADPPTKNVNFHLHVPSFVQKICRLSSASISFNRSCFLVVTICSRDNTMNNWDYHKKCYFARKHTYIHNTYTWHTNRCVVVVSITLNWIKQKTKRLCLFK